MAVGTHAYSIRRKNGFLRIFQRYGILLWGLWLDHRIHYSLMNSSLHIAWIGRAYQSTKSTTGLICHLEFCKWSALPSQFITTHRLVCLETFLYEEKEQSLLYKMIVNMASRSTFFFWYNFVVFRLTTTLNKPHLIHIMIVLLSHWEG